MCSFFSHQMDNYQGDLTDIIRASGRALNQSDAALWEFQSDDPMNFSISSSAIGDNNNNRESTCFGDPFCNMRDPLLHELTDMISTSALDDQACNNFCTAPGANSSTTASSTLAAHKIFAEESSCDIFSRIQISNNKSNNPDKLLVSSCDSPFVAACSPRGFKASALASDVMINANSSTSCLIENTGPVQISSPRNLGIKRRKSQAKKVVCIPAPAAANSRPSGEIVPSDLWAWRKYGQKPIKGSPYPRGYYRCSSSKGCSARKQVERSRTDPNMLVITYTSEHNHPWPTQRNALAGSTRSQPPKSNAGSKTSPSQKTTNTNTKEEQKESSNDTLSPPTNIGCPSSIGGVKEEFEDIEKQMEMDDNELSEGIPPSYRPAMPECSQSDDFFADLGEIEPDPDLDLLFTQGFIGDDDQKESKAALDPFNIFDWSSGDNNSSTSFGEAKRGL